MKCFELTEDIRFEVENGETGMWFHNVSLETYSAKAGTLFSAQEARYYREHGAKFREAEVPSKHWIEVFNNYGHCRLLEKPEWDGPTRGFEGNAVRPVKDAAEAQKIDQAYRGRGVKPIQYRDL